MPMPKHILLPDPLAEFLSRRPGAKLSRIRSEASRRRFFRISFGNKNLVAMVYPEPARTEVERFRTVQEIYRGHGLRVPSIEEILGDQVVIQEDAGDVLLQRAWRSRSRSERLRLLGKCRELLSKLAAVPPELAPARLDRSRQKWEMDFFLKHFFPNFPGRKISADDLRNQLYRLVEAIDIECVFAHRDFHSRNLLVHGGEIIMVDFQDSLLAPRYYDLVSVAFDSYLDLQSSRETLFQDLVSRSGAIELRQMRLTALQRNLKALGTFAFQTYTCHHPAYARYIPRTLRHIRGHLQELASPEFSTLSNYFSALP